MGLGNSWRYFNFYIKVCKFLFAKNEFKNTLKNQVWPRLLVGPMRPETQLTTAASAHYLELQIQPKHGASSPPTQLDPRPAASAEFEYPKAVRHAGAAHRAGSSRIRHRRSAPGRPVRGPAAPPGEGAVPPPPGLPAVAVPPLRPVLRRSVVPNSILSHVSRSFNNYDN